MLNDARVERNGLHGLTIRAELPAARIHDHVFPPGFAQVLFQLRSERTVVPEAVDAAVDLRGLINVSASLAQSDNPFHRLSRIRHRDLGRTVSLIAPLAKYISLRPDANARTASVSSRSQRRICELTT
jgi:hypothetical protein